MIKFDEERRIKELLSDLFINKMDYYSILVRHVVSYSIPYKKVYQVYDGRHHEYFNTFAEVEAWAVRKSRSSQRHKILFRKFPKSITGVQF